MRLFLRLLDYVKPYWKRLFLAMICMLMVGALTGASAMLLKNVIDDVFTNKDVTMQTLLPVVIILLYFFKGLFNYGQKYLMSWVEQRVVFDIRNRLYDHIQGLSLGFFNRTPTGVLVSHFTNDIGVMQGAVSGVLGDLIREPFTILFLVGVLFYRNLELAIISMLVLPFTTNFIVRFGRALRHYSRKAQEKLADISHHLHETIEGVRIVKAFGQESYEVERFVSQNRKFLSHILRSERVLALSGPVMEFIAGLGLAAVVWYGGYQVIKGVTTPGTFFFFFTALLMLYGPLRNLSRVNNTIQRALAATERVFRVLDQEPEVLDKPHSSPLPPIKKGVEFRDVFFRYEDEMVLAGVSFKVKAGETVAIVGMSGAGKTTLVNLLPRFYESNSGCILIDGHDIRDVTVQSLRAQLGIVTQDTILFNDTVRNNIAYGKPGASISEIIQAAQAANAHNFIMAMPEGYDTIIGEKGVRLSGGEKQRIAIARALLRNPPILILDEATSSLDAESEVSVQEALAHLMRGRTTFVIAHRLSTVRGADRIVVLEGGKIVEEGRHEELLARGGIYRRLYELQFLKEEGDWRYETRDQRPQTSDLHG